MGLRNGSVIASRPFGGKSPHVQSRLKIASKKDREVGVSDGASVADAVWALAGVRAGLQRGVKLGRGEGGIIRFS